VLEFTLVTRFCAVALHGGTRSSLQAVRVRACSIMGPRVRAARVCVVDVARACRSKCLTCSELLLQEITSYNK